MTDVEVKFIKKGILRSNILLLKPQVTIEFLKECYKEGYELLGVDAFILKDAGIQPFSTDSIDFTTKDNDYMHEERYKIAEKHISSRMNSDFVFEIVVSSESKT